jgi:replicative DNA helicase
LLGQSKSPLVRDVLTAFLERLEQLSQQRGTLSGVPTGFADLDRLLGGLQRSDLVILAARPAVGKSACALSIAHNAAVRHQRRVGIFSLEMSQEQMVQRLVSMDARIDQQRLRTGWIEDNEWERIVEAMGTLSEVTILIDDTAGISALQLRSKARQWVAEYGELDLIIVDYLQLMRAGDGTMKRSDNRVQIVDEIATELKGLARELNIPVLALAQLSRAVEQRHSKVPQLSDLRESGAIENTADVVMFIYRDEIYNPETDRRNQADIIVAKHRNGPVGEVVLYFERSQTRFRDLEVSPPTGPIVESVEETGDDE